MGQPAWQRDGTLRFVSDRRGWWQPYVHPGRPGADGEVEALTDAAAEFHGPDWVLGQSTMAELADGTVAARMTASGRDSVVRLAPDAVPGGAVPAHPVLRGPALRVDCRAVARTPTGSL